MKNQKFDFLNAYLNITAVIFCKQFLVYTVHMIGLLSYAFYKHSYRSQHISVLTTCTFTFRQVCTIEPSFLNTTTEMHRLLFEGRHLVQRE